MELTDEHRAALGRLFTFMRTRRFGDNRKAAYTAAGVNSTTWKRLETGLSVKEPTLSKALGALVPSSEGDWRALRWSTKDGRLAVAVPSVDAAGVPEPGSDREAIQQLQAQVKRIEALMGELLERRYASDAGDEKQGQASESA